MSQQWHWWMWSVMCGGQRQLWDIWHDLLIVEQHQLPQTGVGDHFQRWGCSCSSFPRGSGHNWGVWENRHTPPLSHQISPHGLAPLGFQHKLDHLRPSSRIVHNCIATDPILHGRTGTSGLPAAATCSWGRGIIHKTGIPDMPICQLH